MERDPLTEYRRYARTLIEQVDPGEARRLVAAALAKSDPRPRPGWARRAVTATLGLALFAGSNIGLAAAADGAVPGDALYPVDRFYERVALRLGLAEDFADERLEEARVLAERGDVPAALGVIRDGLETLPDPADERASAALVRAREELARAEQESTPLEEAPGYRATARLRTETLRLTELAQHVLSAARSEELPQADEFAFELAELARTLADDVVREAQRVSGEVEEPSTRRTLPQEADLPEEAEQPPREGEDREGEPEESPGPPPETPADDHPEGPPSSIPTGPPDGTPRP